MRAFFAYLRASDPGAADPTAGIDFVRDKARDPVHLRADEVRSFCIKDHRRFPKKGDCGPGLGEIDHYRLLANVAFTGLKMPLCCENIFAPLVPPPKEPAGVDVLARRAREFLEVVVAGLREGVEPFRHKNGH